MAICAGCQTNTDITMVYGLMPLCETCEEYALISDNEVREFVQSLSTQGDNYFGQLPTEPEIDSLSIELMLETNPEAPSSVSYDEVANLIPTLHRRDTLPPKARA